MRFRNEYLLELRLENGFTQRDLAAELGVDLTTYRDYESGRVNHPHRGFAMTRLRRRNILLAMESVFELTSYRLLLE